MKFSVGEVCECNSLSDDGVGIGWQDCVILAGFVGGWRIQYPDDDGPWYDVREDMLRKKRPPQQDNQVADADWIDEFMPHIFKPEKVT